MGANDYFNTMGPSKLYSGTSGIMSFREYSLIMIL